MLSSYDASGLRVRKTHPDGRVVRYLYHGENLMAELEHIRIRTYHPESNGTLERFHRSTREALAADDLNNLAKHASSSAAGWSTTTTAGCTRASDICRRRSTISAPPDRRFAERREKLEQGRRERERRRNERIKAEA